MDFSKYEEGLSWHKFLKAYQEEYGLTYQQAMLDAGSAWKGYKEYYHIELKNATKQTEPIIIRRKDIKTTNLGNKKNKVKVPAPPRGKKLIPTYVDDSEEEEEPVKTRKSRVKPPPDEVAVTTSKSKKEEDYKREIANLKAKMRAAKIEEEVEE